jgi:hypothetical protein
MYCQTQITGLSSSRHVVGSVAYNYRVPEHPYFQGMFYSIIATRYASIKRGYGALCGCAAAYMCVCVGVQPYVCVQTPTRYQYLITVAAVGGTTGGYG